MSMTKQAKKDAVEPEARRLRRELFTDEMLDQLMAATDERGLSLTGEGGFLPEMIKAVLERGMEAELTGHLGYDKGDPAGKGSGNSRNGSTPKTVGTEVGGYSAAGAIRVSVAGVAALPQSPATLASSPTQTWPSWTG